MIGGLVGGGLAIETLLSYLFIFLNFFIYFFLFFFLFSIKRDFSLHGDFLSTRDSITRLQGVTSIFLFLNLHRCGEGLEFVYVRGGGCVFF